MQPWPTRGKCMPGLDLFSNSMSHFFSQNFTGTFLGFFTGNFFFHGQLIGFLLLFSRAKNRLSRAKNRLSPAKNRLSREIIVFLQLSRETLFFQGQMAISAKKVACGC